MAVHRFLQEAEMFLPSELSLTRRASFLAGVLCSFVATNASAATNMYIKFEEPAIGGSSSSAGHEKEIEILSWNNGFVQPTSPTRSTAGSGTVEQAAHQNLSFTKYLDTATDALLKHCWSGRQIGKATITCYRSDGSSTNQPVKYLTIEMQHVVISNYSISGGPGDLPVETVSLDYGVVKYTYVGMKNEASQTPPQSMTASPSLHAAAASSCSIRLPGATGTLPVQSWSLTQAGGSSGVSFTTSTNTNATHAVAASQKAPGGGHATLTCGKAASLTLKSAKISQVSSANGLTNVTLTYGAIE
jgi:type VI secretion system secreted protein Hcp